MYSNGIYLSACKDDLQTALWPSFHSWTNLDYIFTYFAASNRGTVGGISRGRCPSPSTDRHWLCRGNYRAGRLWPVWAVSWSTQAPLLPVGLVPCRYYADQASLCLPSLWVFAARLRLVRDDCRNVAVRRGRQVDRIILSPDGEAPASLDLRKVLRLAKLEGWMWRCWGRTFHPPFWGCTGRPHLRCGGSPWSRPSPSWPCGLRRCSIAASRTAEAGGRIRIRIRKYIMSTLSCTILYY